MHQVSVTNTGSHLSRNGNPVALNFFQPLAYALISCPIIRLFGGYRIYLHGNAISHFSELGSYNSRHLAFVMWQR